MVRAWSVLRPGECYWNELWEVVWVPTPSGDEGEGDGGGGGGNDPITFESEEAMFDIRPTCPAVRSEFETEDGFQSGKKWCNGEPMTATRKARILAATAKIRAKGGMCIDLANVIDSPMRRIICLGTGLPMGRLTSATTKRR